MSSENSKTEIPDEQKSSKDHKANSFFDVYGPEVLYSIAFSSSVVYLEKKKLL